MKWIRLFCVVGGLLLAGSLLTSCNKEFPRRMSVITLPVDSLLAIARGHIIDLGEDGISGHGFVYDSNALISANAQRIQLGTSSKTGLYEAMLTNLMPHTRYYINSFVVSGSQTTYGDPVVSFITAMNLPEVKTESLTDITDSTATCHGDVTQDGGAQVTSFGVCWSVLTQPTLLNNHTVDGSGTGKYTGALNHLKRDTTYFVRTYASNNAGTAYGNELSFKAGESHTSPTVTTAEVTAITQTAATTGGEVVSEGGSTVASRGVCWSLNPYPVTTDTKTVDGSGSGQFVSSVTGLTANTTYYLRAYAINAVGTAYGDEKTFSTTPDPVIPTVATVSITNITTTTAQSGGTVLESGGSTVTVRGVCWSVVANPTIADNKTSDGNGVGSFISSISGLTPNTKYYLRAYATNAIGTAYGNEISFTAGQNITTPTVTTTDVVNIAQTTATCGGNVTADGGAAVTVRGVCWSTTVNPTIADSKTIDGSGTGGFLSSLSGLLASTIYYVRAYATNSAGTSYGNQKEFTTLPAVTTPSVTTAPVTNVTNISATSGGTVTNDGGANVTARGVCWSTAYNPTIADAHTNDGTGTGSFISQIAGLQANTFYRVRAFATNSAGTSYGAQQTFSTFENPVLPTVSTAQALNITTTTATTGGTVNSDGGSAVTARGVCYSTSSNPTLANSFTVNGTGMGTFVSNLTSLVPNTTYYVRAYATNIVGTAYGNEVSFTTLAWACGSAITINHMAGVVAPVTKTVTYGTVTNIPGETSKCWITSNLGADHQATAVNDATEASVGWYWQFNRKQGYKHDGTTRTPNTTWNNIIFENLEWQTANDPCVIELGSGWRLPTYTEWYNVDAIGGWTNWDGPWNSGLKMHAAGTLIENNGSLLFRGSQGQYWSNTQYGSSYGWHLLFGNSGCSMGYNTKANGFTLRCIKD